MFLEKRRHRNYWKYFLVYSYKENGKVKKIRVYVGRKLNKLQLSKKVPIAEKEMKERLHLMNLNVKELFLLFFL